MNLLTEITEINGKIKELQRTMPGWKALQGIENELKTFRAGHIDKIKTTRAAISAINAKMPGLEKRLAEASLADDLKSQETVEAEISAAHKDISRRELQLKVLGDWKSREHEALASFDGRLDQAAREALVEARELVELCVARAALLKSAYLETMPPLAAALRNAAESCVHAKSYCGFQISAGVKNPEWGTLEVSREDLEAHDMGSRNLPYWAGVSQFGKPRAA